MVGKDLKPKTYRKYEIARDKFYQIISPKEPVSAITKAVIFVFQAASGLSYTDMAKLVPTDFQVLMMNMRL